jgi:tetratricopeptide (TPR) repeat protein
MKLHKIASLGIIFFVITALPCMAQTDSLETRMIILENRINDVLTSTSLISQQAIGTCKRQVEYISLLIAILAVVATFLGIKGLKYIKELRKLEIELANIGEIGKKDLKMINYVLRAILCLARSDTASDTDIKKDMAKRALQYINDAESLNRPNALLSNWKAYTLRRIEDTHEALNVSKEAINLATKDNDNYEKVRALYNSACYSAILGEKNDAISYLEQAVHIQPEMKNIARNDSDFENIKNEAGFKKITDNGSQY